MNGLLADLHHAARVYLKTPASSGLAIVMLAIAMAIVTAFLSLFSDLVLKPVPGFEASRGLVTIGQTDGSRVSPLSYRLVERIDEEVSSVESIAGVFPTQQAFERDGERMQISVELVTDAFFPELRPSMQLGRPFRADDHDAAAEPVAILSHAFWQSEFGGRSNVLGETVRIYGPPFVLRTPEGEARPGEEWHDYRVVGVMAPALAGTFQTETAVWLPFEQAAPAYFGGAGPIYLQATFLNGLARLMPGASVDAARTEIQGRYGDEGRELGVMPDMRFDVLGGVVRNLNTHRESLQQVRLFLAGSVLLALVAACNVSLFLLSRAPGRRRELAIRMAVGARLKRLARQLMTEAGLIVVTASVIGLLVSLWLAVVLRDLPFLRQADWRSATPLDWRVLGLVFGFTLILTVLVSLAPVAGLRRLGLGAGSRTVSARAGWAQRLAGTAQVSIAAVIAGAALAFGWYLVDLERVDRGFEASGVLFARVTPPQGAFDRQPDVEALVQEREQKRDVIEAIPGVQSVAFGTMVPGAYRRTNIVGIDLPDATDESLNVDLHSVDPEYLNMIDARLIDGRLLEENDRDVVVINAALAERLWGRTDVVGETLPGRLGWEVVGVIRNVAFGHPADDPVPMIFHPNTFSIRFEWLLVETGLTPGELQPRLQAAIDDGDLDFTINSIESVEDAWSNGLAADRARTWLTVASALIVVSLAAFGYYGTQRFLVAAGRREYAILAALGAGPRALGRLVFRRGLALGLPGLAFGSVLAFIVVAWMRDDYTSYAVSPIAVALLVTAAISGVLLAASIGPARVARDTEPAPLLKEE